MCSKKTCDLKVAVFAAPLSGNKGSASMVWGLHDSLIEICDNFEMIVYSYYPKNDIKIAENYKHITVRPGHPKHLLLLLFKVIIGRVFSFFPLKSYKELASANVAIMLGGTTFADSKLYKVPWNMLAMMPAYIGGTPILFLSQTMGPFKKRFNKLAAKWSLSKADIIYGRGEVSTQNVRELGVDYAEYSPDLSLGMNLSNVHNDNDLLEVMNHFDKLDFSQLDRLVGITPNTIVNESMERVGIDYSALFVAIIEEISARGYLPVIIPHSFRKNSKGSHNNDIGLCETIISGLPKNLEYIFINSDLSSQALRVLVGKFSILVASRFHSMISSLDQCVPPITMGWGDQKYSEVLSIYNLNELYIDYSEASLTLFREKLDWVENNRVEIHERLKDGNKLNRSLFRSAINKVIDYSNDEAVNEAGI